MRLATNPIHDFIHVLWARPLKTKGNGRTSGERHDRKIDTLANSAASAVPSVLLRMRRWRQLYSGPNLDFVVAPPFPLPSTSHHFLPVLGEFFLFISFYLNYLHRTTKFSKLPSNLSIRACICRLVGAYCLNFVERLISSAIDRGKVGIFGCVKPIVRISRATCCNKCKFYDPRFYAALRIALPSRRYREEKKKGGGGGSEKGGKKFRGKRERAKRTYTLKFNVYRRTCSDIPFHARTYVHVRARVNFSR